MGLKDAESAILAQMYERWFSGADRVELAFGVEETAWTPQEFEEALARLRSEGAIEARASYTYVLKFAGIEKAERAGYAPLELAAQSYKERLGILQALVSRYEESPDYGGRDYAAVVRELEIPQDRGYFHFKLLERAGLVCSKNTGQFQLTHDGMDILRKLRSRQAFVDEFEELARLDGLTPQRRGQKLQKLLARVIDSDETEWKADSDVWTTDPESPREDTDVDLAKDMVYFNLEAKWEKKALGRDPVGKLFDKLSERVDQKGVLASMSGFNENAIKKVRAHKNQRVILLFGRTSIEDIIYGRRTFDAIAREKLRALVSRQEILSD